jgi:hypothetical protein
MLPAEPESKLSNASRALLLAIDEGQFEKVPTLANEYTRAMADALHRSAISPTPDHRELAIKPLHDALRVLRVIRAHQSARFQKLAADWTCPYAVPRNQHHSRNLDVRA